MGSQRKKTIRLSHEDQARIRRHLREHPNEDMVIKVKNGALGKIYTPRSDEKMRQSAKRNEPWKYRESASPSPDPLGAVELGLLVSPLTREHMYEE